SSPVATGMQDSSSCRAPSCSCPAPPAEGRDGNPLTSSPRRLTLYSDSVDEQVKPPSSSTPGPGPVFALGPDSNEGRGLVNRGQPLWPERRSRRTGHGVGEDRGCRAGRDSLMIAERIKVRCYRCNQLLAVPPNKAGAVVSCPKCKAELLIPTPG